MLDCYGKHVSATAWTNTIYDDETSTYEDQIMAVKRGTVRAPFLLQLMKLTLHARLAPPAIRLTTCQ